MYVSEKMLLVEKKRERKKRASGLNDREKEEE